MKLSDSRNCVTEKWTKIMSPTIELSPPKMYQNADIITKSSRVLIPPLRDIASFVEGGFLLLTRKNSTSVAFNQKKDAQGDTSV